VLAPQCWHLSAGAGTSVQVLASQCRCWHLSAGAGTSVLAPQCKCWHLSAGAGTSVQLLAPQCTSVLAPQCWHLSANAGPSVLPPQCHFSRNGAGCVDTASLAFHSHLGGEGLLGAATQVLLPRTTLDVSTLPV